jgi:hypothetical protein
MRRIFENGLSGFGMESGYILKKWLKVNLIKSGPNWGHNNLISWYYYRLNIAKFDAQLT